MSSTMAVKSSIPLQLLPLLLALVLPFVSNAGEIGVYWGQNGYEGRLLDACNSGLYRYVNIAFLDVFGNNQRPHLNLAGHCDADSGGCKRISTGISACQRNGYKVMLSIGGHSGSYGLSSADDARGVAMYLWNNFLGGDSSDRPLGDARLDGIDFDIEGGNGAPFYRDLAGRLRELGQNKDKYYYLTAAPQCPYPDAWLGDAISTSLIDYIWIQFYNNPQCEYVGNPEGFKNMWNQWVTRSHATKFFVGLPASHAAADASAYIPVDVLNNQVVPFLRGYGDKYGGVMLWNRYEDKSYSSRIRV